MRLAEAIRDVKTRIRHCTICYNLTENDPCAICSDPSRDQGLVCIVEQPKDLLALEAAVLISKGVYHVLLGSYFAVWRGWPGGFNYRGAAESPAFRQHS